MFVEIVYVFTISIIIINKIAMCVYNYICSAMQKCNKYLSTLPSDNWKNNYNNICDYINKCKHRFYHMHTYTKNCIDRYQHVDIPNLKKPIIYECDEDELLLQKKNEITVINNSNVVSIDKPSIQNIKTKNILLEKELSKYLTKFKNF